MTKLYSTKSKAIQNFLEENWQYPVKEVGKTAYYLVDDNLLSLLDYFYIEHQIMIRRI